eukprot:scaffold21570_cov43-Cyclotella_meneghiniana.AAC.4
MLKQHSYHLNLIAARQRHQGRFSITSSSIISSSIWHESRRRHDRCSEDGREDKWWSRSCDTSLFGCDGDGAVAVLQRQRQSAADRWQNLKKGLRFCEGTPCEPRVALLSTKANLYWELGAGRP